MIKQIVVCDKCGKEIDLDRKQLNGLDFCPSCYEKLIDVIQQWIDEDEEEDPVEVVERIEMTIPEPEIDEYPEVITDEVFEIKENEKSMQKYPAKKSDKRTRPDWDKACALKKAGWTNKAIAEECNIALSYINAEIYKEMKKYEARKKAEAEQDYKNAQRV